MLACICRTSLLEHPRSPPHTRPLKNQTIDLYLTWSWWEAQRRTAYSSSRSEAGGEDPGRSYRWSLILSSLWSSKKMDSTGSGLSSLRFAPLQHIKIWGNECRATDCSFAKYHCRLLGPQASFKFRAVESADTWLDLPVQITGSRQPVTAHVWRAGAMNLSGTYKVDRQAVTV